MKIRNLALAACAALVAAPAYAGDTDSSAAFEWKEPDPLQCDDGRNTTRVELDVKGNVNINSVVIRLNGYDVTRFLRNSKNKEFRGTLRTSHGLIVVCARCSGDSRKRRINVLQATGTDWVTGEEYTNTVFFFQNNRRSDCTANGSVGTEVVDPHVAADALQNMWLGAADVEQYVINAKIEAETMNTNNSIDSTSFDSNWFMAPINGFGVNVAALS